MAFSLRSNEKAQEKADKNVFFIDKPAVSAARPAPTQWAFARANTGAKGGAVAKFAALRLASRHGDIGDRFSSLRSP
jgi:hypothetical protein